MSVNVIARGFDMSVCGMSARNHVLRGGFLRLLVHLAAVHYAVDPRLKLGAGRVAASKFILFTMSLSSCLRCTRSAPARVVSWQRYI